MEDEIVLKRLTLIKTNTRYIFTYPVGYEDRIMQEVYQQTKDPNSGIDMFDATTFANQLGKSDKLMELILQCK